MSCLWRHLFAVISLSVISSSVAYTLHKCCPENQQLLLLPDSKKCVDYVPEIYYNISTNSSQTFQDGNQTLEVGNQILEVDPTELYNSTGLPWWLPSDVDIYDEDSSQRVDPRTSFLQGKYPLQIKAGEDLPCSFQSMQFVFKFSFLNDGHLVVHDDEENTTYPGLSYCADRVVYDSNEFSYIVLLCPCLTQSCIRKCCPPGSILKVGNAEEGSSCIQTDDEELQDLGPLISSNITNNYSEARSKFKAVIGHPKCTGTKKAILLNDIDDPNPYAFQITEEKYLVIEKDNISTTINYTEYCSTIIEHESGVRMKNVIYCSDKKKLSDNNEIGLLYGIFVIIGAVFLLATLIVCAVLPELRNLHGRNLMAHTGSFLVAYIALATAHLNPNMQYKACVATGFIIQFSVLAAFFWLNAMCIDISWTFSGLRPPHGSARVRDRKKFIYYSIYAWGSTALISAITAILQYSSGPDYLLRPGIGKTSCFFDSVRTNGISPAMVYFYTPMTILLITNLGLFLYTAFKILAVRRETAYLRKTGAATNTSGQERQRLILYLKLFLLMGVSWVTEIVSYAVGGTKEYWYLTDTINVLRAVFIFILFCCKRTVIEAFKLRLNRTLQSMSFSGRSGNRRPNATDSSRPSNDNVTLTNARKISASSTLETEIHL